MGRRDNGRKEQKVESVKTQAKTNKSNISLFYLIIIDRIVIDRSVVVWLLDVFIAFIGDDRQIVVITEGILRPAIRSLILSLIPVVHFGLDDGFVLTEVLATAFAGGGCLGWAGRFLGWTSWVAVG